MDEIKERLLPIFLRDAGGYLTTLKQFLDSDHPPEMALKDLEAAFRAAHALKGAADLVRAESIGRIASRVEALLGRHFKARTMPTAVEQEALQLAVDWLAPLLSALQGDLSEPQIFVEEALQALDLAEAFPGRTPLARLLDQQPDSRSVTPEDPFAADPDLLEEPFPPSSQDPFAEDPTFGLQFDMVGKTQEAALACADPFAEDDVFLPAGFHAARSLQTGADPEPIAGLPYDPFAEDNLGLDVEERSDLASADMGGSSDAPPVCSDRGDPPAGLLVDGGASAGEPALLDPFADDDDFLAEFEPDGGTDGR